ncbi:ChaN family lipoprotein [Allopusillimonas ginsengisoli]|uniref:ChaN family lipoprotein n=1 Tax=Allopusillimonas ginsengisoli TaxID=453575 RepID=UPI00142F6AF6|nr:ChaN family lipoprotein [Allopusillimonas ginsengisoli]
MIAAYSVMGCLVFRRAVMASLLVALTACSEHGERVLTGTTGEMVGVSASQQATSQAAAGQSAQESPRPQAASSVIDASPAGMAALAALMPQYPIVVLGEVHDNAVGHTLRREALAAALAAGWRPVLAMEQFDSDQQTALDQALATCHNASCVIEHTSINAKGWDWDYYRPVIELAMRYRLPVVAANLSRPQASRVVKHGLKAVFSPDALAQLGLQHGPEPELLRAQAQQVDQGHCGMLPEHLHTGMATAQIARDATMALTIQRAAGHGSPGQRPPVVLLAGNGHVRKDLGVPRWFDDALAVGFTETPASAGLYDRDVVVPPAQRPNPCAAFNSRP